MGSIAVLGLSIFLAPPRANAGEEGALSAEPDATGQSVAIPTVRTGEGIAAPALSSKPFRVAVRARFGSGVMHGMTVAPSFLEVSS